MTLKRIYLYENQQVTPLIGVIFNLMIIRVGPDSERRTQAVAHQSQLETLHVSRHSNYCIELDPVGEELSDVYEGITIANKRKP